MKIKVNNFPGGDSVTVSLNVLHDAEIISVCVDRLRKYAEIKLRTADGALCLMNFFEFKAFRCEDLIIQNVVNRVLFSGGMELSQADFEHWINWATSTSNDLSWLCKDLLGIWMSKLASGDLKMFVFEPSVGATVSVVCERFDFIV